MNYKGYVWGTKANKSGDGGDGGRVGIPGNSSDIRILDLTKNMYMDINLKNNSRGENGLGGIGGRKVVDQFRISVNFYVRHDGPSRFCSVQKGITLETGFLPAGKDGTNGKNEAGIEKPKSVEIENMAQIINLYRSFLRSYFTNSSLTTPLQLDERQLTNNKKLQKDNDLSSLVDDLLLLERDFFEAPARTDLLPWYDSYLVRIENYNQTHNKFSDDDKRVLSLLYSAALGRKLSFVQFRRTVMDTEGFLDLVLAQIDFLKKEKIQNYVNKLNTEYLNYFEVKMNAGKELISNNITEEIDNILHDIDLKILTLVHEISQKRNESLKTFDKLLEMKSRLNNLLPLRKLLIPLNFLAATLSVLGPAGALVGATIGGASSIANTALNSQIEGNEVKLSASFNKMISGASDAYKNQHNWLKVYLGTIEKDIDTFDTESSPSPSLSDMKKRVTEFKADVMKEYDILCPNLIGGYCRADKINEIRKKITNTLNNEKGHIEKSSELHKEKFVKMIDKWKMGATVAELCVDQYQEVRNDEAKLQVLDESIHTASQTIGILDTNERAIYEIVLPLVRNLQEILPKIENSSDKSRTDLSVLKWQMRNTLRDTKVMLHEITASFSIDAVLQRYMDKLDEAMSLIVDIYDRMDSYRDQSKLVSMISAGLTKEASTSLNPQLNNAISDLELTIQTNVVLQYYTLAMSAFKTYVFPFASYYLGKFNLPEVIKSANKTDAMNNAVNNIGIMKTALDFNKVTLSQYGNDIIFCNFSGSNGIESLYTWKYDEIRNDVVELFGGKNVTVKADILKGFHANAVRFQTIDLRFHLDNKHEEDAVLEALKNYSFSMTLVGNSYFRCDDRIYTIAIDGVQIHQSFVKEDGGKSSKYSLNYNKIISNQSLLSPYATWVVQLTKNNNDNDFQTLAQFANKSISISLVGTGHYLKSKSLTSLELCNANLDRYYTLARILEPNLI